MALSQDFSETWIYLGLLWFFKRGKMQSIKLFKLWNWFGKASCRNYFPRHTLEESFSQIISLWFIKNVFVKVHCYLILWLFSGLYLIGLTAVFDMPPHSSLFLHLRNHLQCSSSLMSLQSPFSKFSLCSLLKCLWGNWQYHQSLWSSKMLFAFTGCGRNLPSWLVIKLMPLSCQVLLQPDTLSTSCSVLLIYRSSSVFVM